MANIKSNEKNYKRDAKRKTQRHSQKSNLKTQVKKTRTNKKEEDLNVSYKKIDSAVSKGIIKKNKANRMKSRLTKDVKNK